MVLYYLGSSNYGRRFVYLVVRIPQSPLGGYMLVIYYTLIAR